MANYVRNYLAIMGRPVSQKNIRLVLDDDNEVDFNIISPMPDDVDDADGWLWDNWGTASNACDTKIVSQTDGRIVIQFDTAWDAPRTWLRTLSQRLDGGSSYLESLGDDGLARYSDGRLIDCDEYGEHIYEGDVSFFQIGYRDKDGKPIDEDEYWDLLDDDQYAYECWESIFD